MITVMLIIVIVSNVICLFINTLGIIFNRTDLEFIDNKLGYLCDLIQVKYKYKESSNTIKKELSEEDKQKIAENDYDTRNVNQITTPIFRKPPNGSLTGIIPNILEVKRKPGRPKKVKK